MCEPARLITLYQVIIENLLGETVRVADDDQAIMFHHERLAFTVRNTAYDDPSLLDIAVFLTNEASLDVKQQACLAVAAVFPCLKAWVDDEGDIVLNIQTITGPVGLMPQIGILKDLLPRTVTMLRASADRVTDEVAIVGITTATGVSGDHNTGSNFAS